MPFEQQTKLVLRSLIWDHQGRVRIAFSSVIAQSSSPEHVETITVCEGLKLTKNFDYSSFTIESDYKGVINQLQFRFRALTPSGHIHRQIFASINRLQVLLSFARRSGNMATHLLASKAILNIYPTFG